ncbi:hypothetical protein CSUI_009317 [Cystoisospora suis]|uniref:Uncharacterized protein n=1 Tax=Cystoisospora suis TaxID=483139 RepID=A0A2C6KID0_9APIC|nr:hypothetical protein CSUI_009317 [Cystoisospora suis]
MPTFYRAAGAVLVCRLGRLRGSHKQTKICASPRTTSRSERFRAVHFGGLYN